MATAPVVVPDVKKMSFAKVAASGTIRDPHSVAAAMVRPAVPAIARNRRESMPPAPTTSVSTIAALAVVNGTLSGTVPGTMSNTAPGTSATMLPMLHTRASMEKPVGAEMSMGPTVVEGLKILPIETKTPNLVVNGASSTITEQSSKTGNSQTPSDDNSQRADSSSELGTKPPSLDGKSITSGTTFALDEKESLRPDDSASVKAAAEDDDAFSIRGSLIAPGSRMGSEVAARFHRIQLGDMPPRTITGPALAAVHQQGVATPQSGTSEKQPVTEAKLPLVAGTTTPDGINGNAFYRQNPDDKLLEAMQSPKDRLFLLRLEAQVIEFVQDSKEPFMDLPPSNSFCRMLTHKLADYYHMTHSFEAVAGAVRIYRTPFCRVPPPLSSIVVGASSNSSPAPAVLPRKIMRRGQDGELATTSASPSKPTSEAGSDSKEKAPPVKEKLTREEREEAYNKARERIFGSQEKNETTTPENEDSNGVSRASSVSARDKSNVPKRKTGKQRRDDSESFDSRSQYVAWLGPQQQTWAPSQYVSLGNTQFNAQFQQPYANTLQPVYGPNQSYPQMVPPGNGFVAPPVYNGMPPSVGAVPHYYPDLPPEPQKYPSQQPVPQSGPPQRFQAQNPQPSMAPAYGPAPTIPNAPAQQSWQPAQNFNHSPYQARATPAPGGIPYAYGQLPANINPHDPKSQHPIPGSYNRNHAFNPKIQSFVPGNGVMPMQHAQVPVSYGGSNSHHGSHHGSPQFNSPHMNYNGYHQQTIPQPSFGGNGGSYGMVRQGSNNSHNSLPPYHAPQMPPQMPQQMPQQQMAHVPQHMPQYGPPVLTQNIPPHMPNKPAIPHGANQTYSTLPNYGNPATLPQKPAT